MKILIVSVSAGQGHVSAAQAIEDTAKKQYPNIDVVHIDMMDYVTSAVRHAIVDVYDVLVKTIPSLWGYVYEKTNDEKRMRQVNKIMNRINCFHAKKFYAFVEQYQPDHIICTHSFPAQVIRQADLPSIATVPISLVVTDYGFHSYWIRPDITHYFVATKKMAWEMQRRGIQKSTVTVTGIPVRQQFLEKKDTQTVKKKYGIAKEYAVLLVLAGGQGMMKSDGIVELLQTYQEWKRPIYIIAISGKNATLYEALQDVQKKPKQSHIIVEVVQWTNDIDEYMRMSDVIISKPGGSTTSECMLLGKPMIAVNPIPGQEDTNATSILEQGHGYIARTDEEILYYTELLLQKPVLIQAQVQDPAKNILESIIQK